MLVERSREMEYQFKITVAYDGNAPHWQATYTNAIDAVEAFAKFVDWGTAVSYSTVNLSEPNGKIHTKRFYKNLGKSQLVEMIN